MKVQTIEKECVAKTGISIEFSNSEIDSLVRIALVVDNKIEECREEAHNFIKASKTGTQYKESDDISVKVDLKTLSRISWLLDRMTGNRVHNPSELFNEADAYYWSMFKDINTKEEE